VNNSSGEERLAPSPAWAVAAVSAWVALACNAGLWQAAVDVDIAAVARALARSLMLYGIVVATLSLICWRRTFKPLASTLLVLAAASAASTWLHKLPSDFMDAAPDRLFPGWAALLDWRVSTLLAVLGLVPVLVLWSTQLRRLSGPAQLGANLKGLVLGALLAATGALSVQLLH
jgi:lipid A ethanolaminephosphotransferase